ncbi:hypothetical protein QA811_37600 [Streptomyces sp. B21-102]|uniref:hypothetical protein n=1 Tax=Streptomyces sp. B21-102 TaxID=3039416 RepID=UPI002FF13326
MCGTVVRDRAAQAVSVCRLPAAGCRLARAGALGSGAQDAGAASLEPTLRKAVQSGAPALIGVPTDRDAAGPWVPGWWDFPIPAYITDERQDEYHRTRATEQHL